MFHETDVSSITHSTVVESVEITQKAEREQVRANEQQQWRVAMCHGIPDGMETDWPRNTGDKHR